MAKKAARRPAAPPPLAPAPGRTTAVKVAVAALAAVGLVAGLVWLGRLAGDAVAHRERYSVRVADIQTNAPPHADPRAFLTEVRYLGSLPETVQSVDPKLPDTLSAAFRKHPWVADVTAVTVEPDGRVRVALAFRTPVLTLRTSTGELRALDAAGVLLPTDAPTDGLPVLKNPQLPHDASAGQPWPDPDARRAAELVVAHPAKEIERQKNRWKLVMPDGQVLWIDTP